MSIQVGSQDEYSVVQILNTDGTAKTNVDENTVGLAIKYQINNEVVQSMNPAAMSAGGEHVDGGIYHIGDGQYKIGLEDDALATPGDVRVWTELAVTKSVPDVINIVGYDPEDSNSLGLQKIDDGLTLAKILGMSPTTMHLKFNGNWNVIVLSASILFCVLCAPNSPIFARSKMTIEVEPFVPDDRTLDCILSVEPINTWEWMKENSYTKNQPRSPWVWPLEGAKYGNMGIKMFGKRELENRFGGGNPKKQNEIAGLQCIQVNTMVTQNWLDNAMVRRMPGDPMSIILPRQIVGDTDLFDQLLNERYNPLEGKHVRIDESTIPVDFRDVFRYARTAAEVFTNSKWERQPKERRFPMENSEQRQTRQSKIVQSSERQVAAKPNSGGFVRKSQGNGRFIRGRRS